MLDIILWAVVGIVVNAIVGAIVWVYLDSERQVLYRWYSHVPSPVLKFFTLELWPLAIWLFMREGVAKALRKENETLRGLLGSSSKPCVYCKLPAEEQGRCESGFPGCPRADDQSLAEYFADGYQAHCLGEELIVARQAQISGFYEEMVPTFRQGGPTHELESLVTAEEVTGYVNRITELTKQLGVDETHAERV